MSNRVRQRATLQQKWERQQASAEKARRNFRRALLAGAVVVVLVVALVILNAVLSGKPAKHGASAPSATAAACDWSVIPAAARAKEIADVGTPPASGEPRSGLSHVVIATNLGTIEGDLDLAKAPCAAASLTYLAGKKFFDNTACHRITTGPLSAVYCGDPTGTDLGGPAYRVQDENVPTGQRPAYPAGSIILVHNGPNTNSSQFGLVYQASEIDNPTFPVIGHITSGLDLLTRVGTAGAKDQAFDTIAGTDLPGLGGGHPTTPLTVTSVTVTAPAA